MYFFPLSHVAQIVLETHFNLHFFYLIRLIQLRGLAFQLTFEFFTHQHTFCLFQLLCLLPQTRDHLNPLRLPRLSDSDGVAEIFFEVSFLTVPEDAFLLVFVAVKFLLKLVHGGLNLPVVDIQIFLGDVIFLPFTI